MIIELAAPRMFPGAAFSLLCLLLQGGLAVVVESQGILFPCFGGKLEDAVAVAYGAVAALVGCDCGFGGFALLPCNVNAEISACHQPFNGAFAPCIRQCGKQVNTACMALHQHFDNAGCAPEIAVYLEWRMHIPEVVGRAVLEQVAIELVRMVAVV